KKAMDQMDEVHGGSLVPFPAQGQLIDMLRAVEVLSRVGAQQIALAPQGMYWPSVSGDPAFQWLGPNVQIPMSDVQTGGLTLTPKKAAGLVPVANDLIRSSLGSAEQVVRQTLVARLALTMDLAFLQGSGGTLMPLGVLNYPMSAE